MDRTLIGTDKPNLPPSRSNRPSLLRPVGARPAPSGPRARQTTLPALNSEEHFKLNGYTTHRDSVLSKSSSRSRESSLYSPGPSSPSFPPPISPIRPDYDHEPEPLPDIEERSPLTPETKPFPASPSRTPSVLLHESSNPSFTSSPEPSRVPSPSLSTRSSFVHSSVSASAPSTRSSLVPPSPAPSSVRAVSMPPSTLITAPPIKFETTQVEWKGLPLDSALWTLDSQELQTIVSRAIRSSAQESFIRLLSLTQLDETLPAELERLNFLKASIQSRYRFHVQRRTMFLQALVSSTTASASQKDGGADLVGKLATQLSETTVECDRLTQELASVADQITQVTRLIDNHWASALAIALRKLNGSYGKRTSELIEAKAKLDLLQEELNEAWSEAEKLAEEMDGLTRDLDDMDETGVYSDEGEIMIRKAAVVTLPIPASQDAVAASGKLIDLKHSGVPSNSSRFLRPPSSATGSNNGEEPKSSPEDNDSRSVRSRRSARSAKSGRRVDMITAARTRSMRTSMGSLRLPGGRSSTKINSPSSSSGSRSAPVERSHASVPPVPIVFTPPSTQPPSSNSNSLTPTSNAPLSSSLPSPLSRESSAKNASTESLVDEPGSAVAVSALPPPPPVPLLSPAPQPRARKIEIEDIKIEANRRFDEPRVGSAALSVMDDIIVMPTHAHHEIEEVPRTFRKSVDEVNMTANSRRKTGQDNPPSSIPSIWLNADSPKTPAERVEALMRSSSQKTSYTKLKGMTKRYSLPFHFHGRNASTAGSNKSAANSS
ncbi:hypothetical protein F5878DRAFT_417857 [Lentinula raphanica]|uniref:Uncharacterized protein n=1 Tax=Lentinula raphanica TaxID=153919 RepID=A0AA38UKR8_9AGAR|nr:hypothetical protein F5878DRAFT_417857 [Lentinula raphanica]